jgi:hypothetical protein
VVREGLRTVPLKTPNAELLAREFAGKDVEAGAAFDDHLAVHNDRLDSRRMAPYLVRVHLLR